MTKESIEILAGASSGLAAVIFIIDYGFGNVIKKPIKVVLAVVFMSGLIVLALSLRSTHIDKNSDIPHSDSSVKLQTDPSKKSQSANAADDVIKINGSDTNQKTKMYDTSLQVNTVKTIEVVNKTKKVDFAILATTNGEKDKQLSKIFVDWLTEYGTTSNSILLNSFLEKGIFDQVLDDNSAVIQNTNASQGANYICLIRSMIEYRNSKSVEGVVMGIYSYTVIVIDAKTGEIIDTFTRQNDPFPGISEPDAKRNAESKSFTDLKKRILSI